MGRARRALALAIGLMAVGLPATPAGAAPTPVVVTDRQGDGHGPGDIRALRIARANAQQILLQIKTQQPLDIQATNAWRRDPSATELRINLDVGGSAAIDYALFVMPNQDPTGGAGVRLQSFLPDRPTERSCDLGLSQPSLNLIRVKVSTSCIGDGGEVRAFARYRLDQGGNGTIDSDDRAPNAGFSGFMDYTDDAAG